MSFSLLNFPGGKSRAVHELEKFLPPGTSIIYSPFFGGGAFEIYCATQKNIKVVAADKFKPLVNFWQCILKDKTRVIDGVRSLLPMSREEFAKHSKAYHRTTDRYDQAALYFAINRVSFNGVMHKYSHLLAMRNPEYVIRKMVNFNDKGNISIKTQDYQTLLSKVALQNNGTVLFLDPPYITKEYYYGWKGEMHKGFDHTKLANTLLSIRDTVSWILCYNDCEQVRRTYKDCECYNVSWSHSMSFSNNKQEKPLQNNLEVIIISRKLSSALKL